MTETNSAEKICTERLQQLLASAGTTAVEAPVIQPADIFLNLSGEAL
ncbi:MAG: ATP phosphoribosyltransferase regulatory subunit, partial [Rhodobiaceae bacterium]|nr:ATP phosphoribosyltransferase regulatory subunit [Rhodobiaceae bacterium]